MKQRLIDANKAKVILWGYSRFTGIDEAPYSYAEEAIDILPTIEAIPIEWIKQWAGVLKEKNYHCYQILMPALIEMIEEWEKDNGE